MFDVLLTVTYRFGISRVSGAHPPWSFNTTRGGCVPASGEMLPKTSQSDLHDGISPTPGNMPSNPRNHQYRFFPAGEPPPRFLRPFSCPPPLPPSRLLRDEARVRSTLKCFTLQNQCRHIKRGIHSPPPPPIRSPFLLHRQQR